MRPVFCNSFLVYILLSLALGGCSLEDERDLCCDRYVMYYRYTRNGRECFREYIYNIHYYLFEASGKFIGRKYPEPDDIQKVELENLSSGKYIMIAMANIDDYAETDGNAGNGLADFRYRVGNYFQDTGELANCDPIYWGVSSFTVEKGKGGSYTTEMSNVHCTLTIRLEWEGSPEYIDGYLFQLKGVRDTYSLDPSLSESLGIQTFPEEVGDFTSVWRSVNMEDMALESTVVTLRYTGGSLPVFRLWHNDTPITEPLPLEKAFDAWGWNPDINPVQEYSIRIRLLLNGNIELTPYDEGGINDWINGGTIGN